MSSTTALVVCSVLTVLVAPLVIYGLILWYRFRYHYIIRERYPRVCYIIIASSFLCLPLNIITFKLLSESSTSPSAPNLSFNLVAAAASSFGYIVYSMTVYRALLVFLRWRIVQKQLQFYISANQEITDVRPAFHIHVKRHAVAVAYVISVAISFFYIFIGKGFSIYGSSVSGLPWIFQTFLGMYFCYFQYVLYNISYTLVYKKNISCTAVIIVGITFYYKVREVMGCLTECYVFLSGFVVFYVIRFAIIPLFNLSENHSILFLRIFEFTIMLCSLLMTLLNSLRIILKSERTLNYEVYKERHAHVITNTDEKSYSVGTMRYILPCNNMVDIATVEAELTLDKITINSISITERDDKNNNSPPVNKRQSIDLSQNIFQFLKLRKNYDMFMEYLGYCFAIESLLFVQRVSIFHNYILQRFHCELNEEKVEKLQSDGRCRREHLYRTQYKYLRTLWEKYSHAMPIAPEDKNAGGNFDTVADINAVEEVKEPEVKEVANDEKTFRNCRHSLFVMCQEICEEFIYDQAPQQINIPHEVQQALLYMLVTDGNIVKFSRFADFLYLFDDAMSESYFLLGSIYALKFKAYLKAKFGQQVILERLMNNFI